MSDSFVPSSSDPLLPSAFPGTHHVHGDADLHTGPVDGPDVLEEPDESELPFESRVLGRDLPIRKPTVGETLSIDDLTAELDDSE